MLVTGAVERNITVKDEPISDVEIVNNLVAGKPQAFEIFYQQYSKLIYHCIRSRESSGNVDEYFQDFMLKLHSTNYRSLNNWSRSASFKSYLSVIVRNFVIDRQRANSKKELASGSATDLEKPLGADLDKLPDQKIEARELRKAGLKAWSKLSSDRDRCLICDIYHRDRDNDLISQSLGLSGGTLRKAVFDAKRRFMLSLRDAAPEFFPA